MKNLGIIVIVLCMCILAACGNPLKADEEHATVTLTTSSGGADVWQSVADKDKALRLKGQITLKKDDVAKVTFECNACGNKQEYEISQPWAATLSCDCPEKPDENGNRREYTALSISFEE